MDSSVQIAVAAAIWLWSVLKSSAEGFSKKVGEKLGEKSVEALEELIVWARNDYDNPSQAIDNDPSAQRDRLSVIANKMMSDNRKKIEQAANVRGLLHFLLNNNESISMTNLKRLIDETGADRSEFGDGLSRPDLVKNYVDWLWAEPKRAEIIQEIFGRLNPVLPSKK